MKIYQGGRHSRIDNSLDMTGESLDVNMTWHDVNNTIKRRLSYLIGHVSVCICPLHLSTAA